MRSRKQHASPIEANFEPQLGAFALPQIRGKANAQEITAFTSAKLDRINWILRDPVLNPTEKNVAIFLLQCVNKDNLACFPSYQTVADGLGIKSAKTIERAIRELLKAGWIEIRRFDRNKSNRYMFLKNQSRVDAIDQRQINLRELREEERRQADELEQTNMSGRVVFERTNMSGPEQTNMSGKHLKVIPEVNSISLEERGSLNPYELAKDGDPTQPFDIPVTDVEADEILAVVGNVHPIIRQTLRKMLMDGTCTPALLASNFGGHYDRSA